MDNLPVPIRRSNGIRPLPEIGPLDLLNALLADSRCANSRMAREHDCRVFGRFLGLPPAEALAELIAHGRGQANAIVLAYRDHEARRGASGASNNRRLATLGRAVKLARRFELLDWVLEVDRVQRVPTRNVQGPSHAAWCKLWDAALAAGDGALACRDRLLVRLLRDQALRCSEAASLNYPEDVNLAESRVRISGKGQGGNREWLTISAACVSLTHAWLEARGTRPGPLLVSGAPYSRVEASTVDPRMVKLAARIAELHELHGFHWLHLADALNAEGYTTSTGLPWTRGHLAYFVRQRLDWHLDPDRGRVLKTASSRFGRLPLRQIHRIFVDLSAAAGIPPVLPHSLRHYAISRGLQMSNGNVQKVQAYARHRDPKTTLVYAHVLADQAGEITRLVGDD